MNYLFGNKIAPQAPGADLERQGSPPDFSLDFLQVRLPDPPGTVIGMAYRIAGNGVLSTNIAGS